jgi:hypothetical protein
MYMYYVEYVARTVVFSSEGQVGTSMPSYLGRYYMMRVEGGRMVYQHEKGAPFLHYIDDPLHR